MEADNIDHLQIPALHSQTLLVMICRDCLSLVPRIAFE